MKNSFVLYTDYRTHINLLSNEEKGILFDAILCYAAGEKMPELSGMAEMAFSFIKAQMDRDNEEYLRKIKARSEAGKLGGRPKTKDLPENQIKAKKANAFSEKQNEAKKADTVTDNVTVTENDKDNMSSPTSGDRPAYPYEDIIEYLNQRAGTNYRHTSEDSRKHIRARFVNGYTFEDFKTVIDKKVAEWKGTEQERYLRPATLFGPKFESYLNQRITSGAGKVKPTRFTNFRQRDYDFDELESKLLGAQQRGGTGC